MIPFQIQLELKEEIFHNLNIYRLGNINQYNYFLIIMLQLLKLHNIEKLGYDFLKKIKIFMISNISTKYNHYINGIIYCKFICNFKIFNSIKIKN